MIDWLITPLQYGFFQRGLLSGLIAALSCGVLSAFIVWRGMAFLGDALAHAVLPGIVVAVILGIHILLGALGAAVLSVLGISFLTRHQHLHEDTVIGVIFSGAFALGILMMSRVANFRDLSHILFGNILGVSRMDLVLTSFIAALVVFGVVLFYKELLVTSFDKAHARAIGLSPGVIHFALLVLIAATTVLASQTVGVVLVLALLVTPAAAASLLVREMKLIIIVSVIFAVLAVIAGFYLSYYMDWASGAAIVLVLTVFFIFSYGFSRILKRNRGRIAGTVESCIVF